MADDAACRGTQLAMSGHMARDAADDGPFDAAFGVRSGRKSERKQGGAGPLSKPSTPFRSADGVVRRRNDCTARCCEP
jgi:hypothetical protein